MDVTWERLPNEPNRWYERLETYRLLGADRSVDAAYRTHTGKEGRANRHWYAAAERWGWLQRAEAWDAAQREVIRQREEGESFDARRLRIERIKVEQAEFYDGLKAANLGKLSETEARQMLAQLRMGFAEMVRMERLEYGEATERVAGDDSYPTLPAEVLRRLELVYGQEAGDENGEEDG
jgi:hypothetical protein